MWASMLPAEKERERGPCRLQMKEPAMVPLGVSAVRCSFGVCNIWAL